MLLEPLFLHQRDSAVVRTVVAPDILGADSMNAPKLGSHCTQKTEWQSVRSSTVARLVVVYTAQQMLDLPGLLRNGTGWPTLDMDVCEPDCE